MFGFLVFVGFIILVWKIFTPKGGWDDRDGGWWGRWRPRIEPPQDPPPLPKSWDPPDYIPEWVFEDVGPVWIPRPRNGPSETGPIRVHRTDSP